MKQLWLTAKLDIVESLRARWFQIYTLVFGGIVALLFMFGLTESRVLGFIGLSRLLVTYIQLTMAILPIFVLITTVRSVAGDREAGVFEYLLSLPVSLSAWFWGKIVGRYIVVFAPVFLAMLGAVGWGRRSATVLVVTPCAARRPPSSPQPARPAPIIFTSHLVNFVPRIRTPYRSTALFRRSLSSLSPCTCRTLGSSCPRGHPSLRICIWGNSSSRRKPFCSL